MTSFLFKKESGFSPALQVSSARKGQRKASEIYLRYNLQFFGGRGTGSSTTNTLYNALGISPEVPDLKLRNLTSQRDQLQSEIDSLYEELEAETIHNDDPEIKALGGLLASMFDKYTDRGEEIREEIKGKRNQQDGIASEIQKLRNQHEAVDAENFKKEMVVWKKNKPQLVEKKQNNYKGFSLDTKTGSIQNAIEKGDAIIVEMSPKEYLQRISYDVFGSSLQRGVRGISMKNVEKYAKQMRSGTKFDMPWIDMKNKGQEGRHRALAAILNGYQKIPVAVRVNDGR